VKTRIKITEVAPRDGLQNEPAMVPTDVKIALIQGLKAAGLKHIEATSFVHPERVPTLADAEDVFRAVSGDTETRYTALVPNLRGYQRALAAGCRHVAVFTAASDAFAQANVGMDTSQSLEVFREIARHAASDGVSVRGYVSTVFGCPYEGDVPEHSVVAVADALLAMGCYEISLGDTIGVGTPADVKRVSEALERGVGLERMAWHFHDTFGMAAANVVAGLESGVHAFDASAGGLGGCPYAPGASGNLATEDLVYLLEGLGHDTGVDLHGVIEAAALLNPFLDRPLPGKVHQALMARRNGRGSC